MAKYKTGDVLEVLHWDQGNETWEHGLIRIVEHEYPVRHTKNGMYSTQHIKGTVKWISVNSDVLDLAGDIETRSSTTELTWIKYLGNIGNSKALEVLYGRRE